MCPPPFSNFAHFDDCPFSWIFRRYYSTSLSRLQITPQTSKVSRDICTPEDRFDRFSTNVAQSRKCIVSRNSKVE